MKPLVIYHADCTDGFGAAFAAWLKLGNDAEYYAARYGDKALPDWQGREVYILDFSFERKVMEHIFQTAKRVVWLDHHKTAFEMWCAKFPYHFEKDGTDDEKYIVLDNNKSGAFLAWEYFHPNTEVPTLIRHIDDRDRWQFKLEGSKELHAALQSYKPWNFEQWKRDFLPAAMGKVHLSFEATAKYSELMKIGAAILRAQEQNITSMLKQARKCRIERAVAGGARISLGEGLSLNAPLHQSEIGHELANQSSTYGLVWYMGVDNRVKCSLRSNGEYDVSAIARAFGGGGHRNAAGFETDIETLIQWLK